MSLTDVEFVDLVQAADDIIKLQASVKQRMSDAFFGMAIARKGGCIVTPYNCREDFDANVTVSEGGSSGYFEVFESKPELNPLLLISGLPPPSLKNSQKHFNNILRDVVDIANLVNKIQRLNVRISGGGLEESVGAISLTDVEKQDEENRRLKTEGKAH